MSKKKNKTEKRVQVILDKESVVILRKLALPFEHPTRIIQRLLGMLNVSSDERMRTLKLSPAVLEALAKKAKPFEKPRRVIRRLLEEAMKGLCDK